HPGQHRIVAQRAETLMVTQQFADALPLWRQLNGHPRAVAARVLCELMQDDFSIDRPPANEREASQEFLNWYRNLVRHQAVDGAQAIAERLETLRTLLPSAADALEQLLAAVAAEAA
ncbi:MAG TPA: hypothetical protein DCY13_03200, partial [Verrucomicrobiales bacterium]|nr:hypothetical protein [Verrucomicrobiales bacterium]